MKPSKLLLSVALVLAASPLQAQKDVLELTAPVLERFITAHQAELTARDRAYTGDPLVAGWWAQQTCAASYEERIQAASSDEARDVLFREIDAKCMGRLSPKAKYEQCMKDYAPRLQDLRAQYEAARKKGDNAAMQRIAAQGQSLDDKAENECGEDPGDMLDTGSPPEMTEAEQQEEAARSQRMMELDEKIAVSAANAGQFTDRQYAIVRERVIAYLRRRNGDDSDSVRGYKFSATESAALASFEARLRKLLMREVG